MKKLLACLLCLLIGATLSFADLTWGAADLIVGGIPDINSGSHGWLVQMFHDQDSDSVLSSLGFMTDGTPIGTNADDDLLLGTYVCSLVYEEPPFGDPMVTFSEIFASYTDLYNESVYSVILDTTSWAASSGANSTFVLDSSSHLMGSSGEEVYAVPNNNPGSHSWVGISAIPEPATMSLLALGGLALAIRRKKQG